MQVPGALYKTCNIFYLIKEGMMSLYRGMGLLLRTCVFDIDARVYIYIFMSCLLSL